MTLSRTEASGLVMCYKIKSDDFNNHMIFDEVALGLKLRGVAEEEIKSES